MWKQIEKFNMDGSDALLDQRFHNILIQTDIPHSRPGLSPAAPDPGQIGVHVLYIDFKLATEC